MVEPELIVGNIAHHAAVILCKINASKNLKESLDELRKGILGVQRLVPTTASDIDGEKLQEPEAVEALQDVLQCLEQCHRRITRFASKDSVIKFLLSGIFLAQFKDLAGRLAASLGALQAALGLSTASSSEEERQAGGDLAAQYDTLRQQLTDLELNVLYFLSERASNLKAELLAAVEAAEEEAVGDDAGGGGGGGGGSAQRRRRDDAVALRRMVLEALEDTGVGVGSAARDQQQLPAAQDKQQPHQHQAFGASVAAAIRAELEDLPAGEGGEEEVDEAVLDATAFLVTVAHVLTAVAEEVPPPPPPDGPPAEPHPAAASAPEKEAAEPQQQQQQQQQHQQQMTLPGSFVCPITLALMRDPVMLVATGHTFEREAIEGHLAGSNMNPVTNLPLPSKAVAPNISLRSAIEEWLQQHGLTAEEADELEPADMSRPQQQRPQQQAAAAAAGTPAAPATPAAREAPAAPSPQQQRPDGRSRRNLATRRATSRQEVDLLEASAAGDVVRVMALLQDPNLSPNVQHQDGGATPLHLASEKGHKRVVQLLLTAGADVAAREEVDANTALYLASRNGHAEVASVLLGAGADFESRNPAGETALHIASLRRHTEVERILLAAIAAAAGAGVGSSGAFHSQMVVGSKVAIRYMALDDAVAIQSEHGGWAASMERALGRTGEVVGILANGDLSVQMGDGSGTKRWSPALVMTVMTAPGPAFPAHVMSPPSSFSSARISKDLLAVEGRYTVRYKHDECDEPLLIEVGSVQADFPAPPPSLVYYFEVKVLDAGRHARIAVGYANSGHPTSRSAVGWVAGSFGLHGDDGKTFWERGSGDKYDAGFTYGTGDVVGAALDFQRKEIFFTKNGNKGRALRFHFVDQLPLYPTLSLQSRGAALSVNFGQSPFVFDVEPYKAKA